MLNKEKYAKEIVEALLTPSSESFGVEDGKPHLCRDIYCNRCELNNKNCDFINWANSECVESTVDWSKVPVDTPILVRDNEDEEWRHRHFKKIYNGHVIAWDNGGTSWSTNVSSIWKYAKLAEGEGD